ncbi:MAG: tRNA epoxyqueuosine(34) reductase QueG, partial [Pseudomonadota bacterium]
MKGLKDRLIARAREVGFSACRIAPPDAATGAARGLEEFLAAEHHGQMSWMEERAAWRSDPSALWPAAQSVIMLAEVYTPDFDPVEVLGQSDRGAISVYARGADYHDLVKKRLKRLGRWLIDAAGGEIKVFVDTAPVMEKPLAQAAGLGWQGKHTNLVSRDLGSWFFLGSIFTTLKIDPDPPEIDHCGSCPTCRYASRMRSRCAVDTAASSMAPSSVKNSWRSRLSRW